MDLEKLLNDGVITKETFDWLFPLWQQELDELRQVRDAQAHTLFSTDCESEEDDGLMMMSSGTIHDLKGMSFSFWMDTGSTGHGNRVWHASVAMCLYLKRHHGIPSNCSFRCLELGAGTALPSLYLGHLISANCTATAVDDKPVVHITDAKQYRNIRQILVSLSKQPSQVLERLFSSVAARLGSGIRCERYGCVSDARVLYDRIQSSPLVRPDFGFRLHLQSAISRRLNEDDCCNSSITKGRHRGEWRQGHSFLFIAWQYTRSRYLGLP